MPIDPAQLLLFVPAALALNLTPGADMLFCLGQGLRSGPRAGVAASVGIAAGSFVHSLLAAFGLAALLAAHPLAFEVLRWGGVAYLLWLAIGAVRRPHRPEAVELGASVGNATGHAFRDGALVNLLNPKVAIFVLAFVPQFVDPARGSTVLQFLIYGAILSAGGTLVNGLVGGFAGRLGSLLAAGSRTARLFDWLSATVYVGLASRIALERR